MRRHLIQNFPEPFHAGKTQEKKAKTVRKFVYKMNLAKLSVRDLFQCVGTAHPCLELTKRLAKLELTENLAKITNTG